MFLCWLWQPQIQATWNIVDAERKNVGLTEELKNRQMAVFGAVYFLLRQLTIVSVLHAREIFNSLTYLAEYFHARLARECFSLITKCTNTISSIYQYACHAQKISDKLQRNCSSKQSLLKLQCSNSVIVCVTRPFDVILWILSFCSCIQLALPCG